MNEDYYRQTALGLTVILNRMIRQDKKKNRPDVPWSMMAECIDEWIHSSIDRQLLKDKLHDEDITFDQLSERYNMTVQNAKKRFYKAERRLYEKMNPA